jgi:hypothetical protein
MSMMPEKVTTALLAENRSALGGTVIKIETTCKKRVLKPKALLDSTLKFK